MLVFAARATPAGSLRRPSAPIDHRVIAARPTMPATTRRPGQSIDAGVLIGNVLRGSMGSTASVSLWGGDLHRQQNTGHVAGGSVEHLAGTSRTICACISAWGSSAGHAGGCPGAGRGASTNVRATGCLMICSRMLRDANWLKTSSPATHQFDLGVIGFSAALAAFGCRRRRDRATLFCHSAMLTGAPCTTSSAASRPAMSHCSTDFPGTY